MKVLHRRGVFLATVLVICAVCGTHSQGADIDEFQDPRDTSPPSISKQPKPSAGQEMYIMDARVPLELECGATGTPPPTYKWLKYDPDGTNPVELDPSDARIMINEGDLKVGIASPVAMSASGTKPSVVTEEDEGLYQCIAENSYGAALSKKINASIAFMDAFSWTSSKTVTAQIGEKTVLECNPPNGVPPSYMSLYWTTGIPPQPIETTARVLQDVMGNLVFANAQPEDTKDYKCNAPNQFIGEVKTSPVIQFIVLEDSPAPERGPTLVSKPPIEAEVLRTKTLSLKCIAEGNPTPEITWSWTTNPGDRAEANGAELKVRNVEFEDEGDYTCTASNGAGADVSYTTTVTVRSAPYWDPNPPTDTSIAPKESVTMTCQSGGSPAATVSWLINGKTEDEVEANPRRQIISGQGSGQIIVTNAETSDSAVFQCIAKNVYGEEITSVFLNVLAIPAEIRRRPNTQYEIAEGSSVEMKCKPYGKPNPTVTWSFNGETLSERGDDSRYSIETGGTNEGMLTITDLVLEDDGVYTCNVTNDFGTEAANPRLIVRKKTTITEGPGEIEVEEGQNAVLKCVVDHDDNLELNVQWDFNGNRLDTDVDHGKYRKNSDESLTVIKVAKSDHGSFMCTAITTFSNASETGMLTVLSTPDAPYNVEVASSDADAVTVTLEWMPGNDGNSEITEYIVEGRTEYDDEDMFQEIKTVSASTTRTELELKPYNTYNFQVKAVNSVGTSMASEVSIEESTEAKPPREAPTGLWGRGPDPGVMVIDWERMSPVDYAGPDFEYVLKYKPTTNDTWTTVIVDANENSHRVTSNIKFQEYDIELTTRNAEGTSTAAPLTQTGFSGESEPTAAPTNVEIEVESHENVRITWDPVPAGSINGKIEGYIVYYSIDIAAGSEEEFDCGKTSPCIVNQLKPYSDYSLSMAVKNGAGLGPRSDTISFSTLQGPPSRVENLELRSSSDRIQVTWERPIDHNGVLDGYKLTYDLMLGEVVDNKTEVKIASPDTLRYVIENLKPNNNFRISVEAKTSGFGYGLPEVQEAKTRPNGVPTETAVGKPIFDLVGPESVNVSFVLPKSGPAADHMKVRYHKEGDDVSKAKTTESVDTFETEEIFVPDLERNTVYVFQLVAVNNHGEQAGPWVEQKTGGSDTSAAGGFKVEGWFIALVVIIIVLLLILLIICVLKSQKGGKYNVSDKESQLKGDIESTPLKDEAGFEEFQPRDGNMDEGAPLTSGSHPSLQESEAASSETDSLKEYADGDTGKFNEEGSFIGQYGDRKTRPPDETDGTAAYSTFV